MEQECDFDDYNEVIVEDKVATNETDLDLELTTELSMASGEDLEEHTSPTCSFKIVTDNVDRTINEVTKEWIIRQSPDIT